MDVELTDEQRMLVDVAREIAESSAFPGQRLQEAPPVEEPGAGSDLALRLHVLRGLSAPGPEASISKLLSTSTEQLLHHVSMNVHEARALVGARPDVLRSYLYSRSASIAGGTSQIQRSLVAERLLELPRTRQ